ncbi:MAG: class I SAM-dependent methyltransferase [Planctomycetes bacterium]|nr:class I SAM-dependent methyltransferase [Planctomycetota bacterium]
MALTFQTDDWQSYKMDYGQPHRELEPLEKEIAVVDAALGALREAGVLPRTSYDQAKMLAHRKAVAELFEIPWTAITPRMQRLLYAINAIAQPQNVIAAGVFCGNTFISNAGAAVGPGASYTAKSLIGVEIKPNEAERAERNVRRIDPTGVARVVAADAIEVCRNFPVPIHLLYLDADGGPGVGKGIYLTILQAALDKLPPGAIVLAHNSVNGAGQLQRYFAFVRDKASFGESVNVILDGEGLEVTVR